MKPPESETVRTAGHAVAVGLGRPAIAEVISAAELSRWYWTKDELASRLRDLGQPCSGPKEILTSRLAAVLDGDEPEPPQRLRGTGFQLADPVDATSVIPAGQRCSQVLRRFFETQIGPGFHFDPAMRDFVATGAGKTLADAVAHWYSTRDEAARPIGRQFQYNQFVRDWHASHHGGSHADAVSAWQAHRAEPFQPSDLLN